MKIKHIILLLIIAIAINISINFLDNREHMSDDYMFDDHMFNNNMSGDNMSGDHMSDDHMSGDHMSDDYMYDSNSVQKKRFNIVKPEIIKKIYKMLFILNKVFEENNIEYWMDGGTFLGAIRHQGIIPWDDDGDVEIWEKDEQKLKNIAPIFKKYNLSLMPTWFGYKIFYNDSQDIPGYKWKYPAVDIFVMKKNPAGHIIFKYKKAEKAFNGCKFDKDIMYPLQKYKFGSFELTGVNAENINTYFDKCYGNDWNDYAYEQYDHENEKRKKKVKVKLTKDEKKPAQPVETIYLE